MKKQNSPQTNAVNIDGSGEVYNSPRLVNVHQNKTVDNIIIIDGRKRIGMSCLGIYGESYLK